MSEFTRYNAPASIEYSPYASEMLGKDYWRVNRPFKFYVEGKHTRYWVNIPEGYLTDGASIPRALWSIYAPWGNYGQAAIVHDYLCEFLSVTENGVPRRITREQADGIFNIALSVAGVDDVDRKLLYAAVSAYRIAKRIKGPTHDPRKRTVENSIALRILENGLI